MEWQFISKDPSTATWIALKIKTFFRTSTASFTLQENLLATGEKEWTSQLNTSSQGADWGDITCLDKHLSFFFEGVY